MDPLPASLLNAWTLKKQHNSFYDDLKGWTTSSLVESYIKAQLERYYNASGHDSLGTSSLCSSVVESIIEHFPCSDDIITLIETLAQNLDATILQLLLRDPRLPYQLLRACDVVLQAFPEESSRC